MVGWKYDKGMIKQMLKKSLHGINLLLCVYILVDLSDVTVVLLQMRTFTAFQKLHF